MKEVENYIVKLLSYRFKGENRINILALNAVKNK